MNAKELFEKGLNEFIDTLRSRFDELHILKNEVAEASILRDSTQSKDAFLDDFFEYLITAYEDGNILAEDMLGVSFKADNDKLTEALSVGIAGKTYKDRVAEYLNDYEGMARLASTEYHRMFNAGIFDGGISHGATLKTWQTMEDDKVRDTHFYLNGTTVPIDQKFYTYDDDSADYPNGFSKAENNVNCRCYLKIS